MRIKSWKNFKESISGWELVGQHMGPNYPEQKLPTSISNQDTNVLMAYNGEFYTEDEYIKQLYPEYLAKFPNYPLSGFNQKNLDIVVKSLFDIC